MSSAAALRQRRAPRVTRSAIWPRPAVVAIGMQRASLNDRRRALEAVLGPQIVGSIWVRRLARISFLGTLDRHPDSREITTRLDHSSSVAALGQKVAAELDLPAEARREFIAACLLHDIGHFPLSHSAEAGFEAAIGVGHHRLSEWIVLGNGRIDA